MARTQATTEQIKGVVLDAGSDDVTGTLGAANGGTGNATNTLNSILVGNGTGAITGIAPSTSGNVLTSNGTTWASTAPPAASTGTYASRPAAATAGRLYFCTDVDAVFRDTGSAWARVGGQPGGQIAEPPTASWSSTTMGTSSVSADKDGYLMTAPGNTSAILRVHYRTLSPTSNYTATAYVDWHIGHANYVAGFLALGDGTKWITFGPTYNTTQNLVVGHWTNTTTFSTSPGGFNGGYYMTHKWLRIRDNGTNHFFEASTNGTEWNLIHSQSRTAFLTNTVVGWGLNPQIASTTTLYARLRGFAVT